MVGPVPRGFYGGKVPQEIPQTSDTDAERVWSVLGRWPETDEDWATVERAFQSRDIAGSRGVPTEVSESYGKHSVGPVMTDSVRRRFGGSV